MKTIDLYKLTSEVEPLIKIQWVTPTLITILGAKAVKPGGSVVKVTTVKNHQFSEGDTIYIHGVEDDLIKGFFKILAVEKPNTFTIEYELDEPFRGGNISAPKTYKVFEKDDLPVRHFARYNQAQANMMQALELVSPSRAKATLAKAVAGNMDEEAAENEMVQGMIEKVGESDSISWSDLATYATKQLQQSCAMLEALAQMPEDLLINTGIPASVVASVYQMVQEAVDSKETVEETNVAEGNVNPVEEIVTEQPKTPRKRKPKAKEPQESTKTTSMD